MWREGREGVDLLAPICNVEREGGVTGGEWKVSSERNKGDASGAMTGKVEQ